MLEVLGEITGLSLKDISYRIQILGTIDKCLLKHLILLNRQYTLSGRQHCGNSIRALRCENRAARCRVDNASLRESLHAFRWGRDIPLSVDCEAHVRHVDARELILYALGRLLCRFLC